MEPSWSGIDLLEALLSQGRVPERSTLWAVAFCSYYPMHCHHCDWMRAIMHCLSSQWIEHGCISEWCWGTNDTYPWVKLRSFCSRLKVWKGLVRQTLLKGDKSEAVEHWKRSLMQEGSNERSTSSFWGACRRCWCLIELPQGVSCAFGYLFHLQVNVERCQKLDERSHWT